MYRTLLVYTDEPTGAAVKKAVGRKGSIVKIESLSQLHRACRKDAADALFIGKEEWDVFGCTALHPEFAPNIRFPIILVSSPPLEQRKKKEMTFRFVSVPESQKSRAEANGYNVAIRPFLSALSPLFTGAQIKVFGPSDPAKKLSRSEKAERERQIEIARGLCTHKKCREVFEQILSRGDEGAELAFICYKVWPGTVESHKRDVQSYVSKMRKAMRKDPECNYTIICKGRRYFFAPEENE